MNTIAIRIIIYSVIQAGQVLLLGIKDTPMTGTEWIKLIISAVMAAGVSAVAKLDNAGSRNDSPIVADVARSGIEPQKGAESAGLKP